jgi:hypothetical protein
MDILKIEPYCKNFSSGSSHADHYTTEKVLFNFIITFTFLWKNLWCHKINELDEMSDLIGQNFTLEQSDEQFHLTVWKHNRCEKC